MNGKKSFRASAAIAGIITLAAASGCSSANSSGGDVLNVGQISDSVAFFPLYVAEEQGFFDEEGVTLGERPRLGTGAKLAAALTSGSIDVGAGVITDAFNLAENNSDAMITGSLVTEYYVDVIAGDGFEGPGSDAPLEDRIRALEGKKIGITGPGSGTEALLIYLFNQVGLDAKKDATLVNLGAVSSSAIGAMSSGQVDALAFFQPAGQMAEAEGVGEIYISPQRGDVPNMTGSLHGVLFSTGDLIEAKGEQVDAFNAGIDRALEFIADNPDESAELLTSYLEGTDPAAVKALEQILPQEMAASTAVERSAFDTAVEFHNESGLIGDRPDYSEVVWDSVRD
ncbi:ABC transporter substrate-binding protein [Brevibacterium luteolum]|uniref:ABC transporter substrate-binding protein n=1 Tax=Brevibacterium luteolum TaxID=199591 RepID=UPI00223B6CD9|nr:ABC transporter substrate-binding protein [Brevibacterium luteolum]MCT1655802.1 ABC transporter substrate-binding protein [Brevibacterium luteolum]